MVVTSVVTYTFPIGPFLGAPSSRYGPSVDWGVPVSQFNSNYHGNYRYQLKVHNCPNEIATAPLILIF